MVRYSQTSPAQKAAQYDITKVYYDNKRLMLSYCRKTWLKFDFKIQLKQR